ncbi:MAG: N-acetyltransferase [Mariprofundales bacterium]
MTAVCLRPAHVSDVDNMHALLSHYAKQKLLLPRNMDDLFQHLQEFIVAIDTNQQFLGMAALHVYESSLAEIRSLIVAPNAKGHGIGKQLVQYCEQEAFTLEIKRIFALTYVDDFFIKQGYQCVALENLPHKIWTVCIHCDNFTNCTEIAVEKKLS